MFKLMQASLALDPPHLFLSLTLELSITPLVPAVLRIMFSCVFRRSECFPNGPETGHRGALGCSDDIRTTPELAIKRMHFNSLIPLLNKVSEWKKCVLRLIIVTSKMMLVEVFKRCQVFNVLYLTATYKLHCSTMCVPSLRIKLTNFGIDSGWITVHNIFSSPKGEACQSEQHLILSEAGTPLNSPYFYFWSAAL